MKKYPFSVQKHAHSIEFFYNHIKNTLNDVESGEIMMDAVRYNKLYDFLHQQVLPLYEEMFNSRDGRIVYLTGAQIGLAKKIVIWASDKRAASLIASGKTEYLKYC